MAAKKTIDLVACTVCDMYGSKEQFTDESYDTCKNCDRLRHSEEEVRVLKEEISAAESARRSLESEKGASKVDGDGAAPKIERLPAQKVVEEQISKTEFRGVIDKALAAGQHFILGIYPVTKKIGFAKDALYECEGRTLDQKGVDASSDQMAKNEKQLTLLRTFYTQDMRLKSALDTYKSLKSIYCEENLGIKDDEKDLTVDTERTIVYLGLRMYDRHN